MISRCRRHKQTTSPRRWQNRYIPRGFGILPGWPSVAAGIGFQLADFSHAAGVAAALEFRLQPDFDHAIDQFCPKQISGKAQNIQIVVSAAHFGRHVVVTGRRTDAGELIG